MIMIIGSEGSMGARYKAILSYLGKSYIAIDVNNINNVEDQLQFTTEVILCTPTDTHFKWLEYLIPTGKKILCEKPITKSLIELGCINDLCLKYKNPITMVMQYQYLVSKKSKGTSFYDYFRTGKDGLYWDCFQIIVLSKDILMLCNSSPIWTCMINGKNLKFQDMDGAYISFITDWLSNTHTKYSMDTYYQMHKKVHDAINSNKRS